MNDVSKLIYGTLIGFLALVVLWVVTLLIFSCGFSFECVRAAPIVERTPIPTLIPVNHAVIQLPAQDREFSKCEASATELIGAWVSAGASESDLFSFTDLQGQLCEATYADIQPLFVENGQWYANAIGCVSCHNSALSARSGGLDLTSYDALQMGAQRADASAKGIDIFGAGDWGNSSLLNVLVNQGMVPTGHSAEVDANVFVLYVGSVSEATATPTP